MTGLLKAVLYQEGRDVKKGDRLYQIDPVPFKLPPPAQGQDCARPKLKSFRQSRTWRG